MKKKVLLFACVEKNIGDDLFIETTCMRYPHIQFVITDAANYGSLAKIENLNFSSAVRRWMVLSEKTALGGLKAVIARISCKLLELRLGKFDDAVYIVGNALKNTNYAGWKDSQWLSDRIRLAERFYLLSTNFGPCNDDSWLKDVRLRLAEATDVCFRDKASYALFSDLGNVRYAPDAVLTRRRSNQQTDKEHKLVVVSVIDCAFAARDEWLRNLSDDYEKTLVRVVRGFVADGYHVVLLNSNAEQDRPASVRICEAAHCSNVEIIDYAGDLRVVDRLYKEASAVVATRLHPIILSWLYSVPVFPIAYDQKVVNLLECYGTCSNYLNIRDVKTLQYDDLKGVLMEGGFSPRQEVFSESLKQYEALDRRLARE